MTLEEALTAKLRAVLGGNSVYPDGAPQGSSAPLEVVYQQSGDDKFQNVDGKHSKYVVSTFTVEAFGDDRIQLAQFREQLAGAFDGYQGEWWGGPQEGIWVQSAVASEATADAELAGNGSEDLDRAQRMSVRISW
ncbi:MAG: hypothetical protein ACRC8S_00595, partial [Fimbriiglobus sp.]